MPGDTGTDWRAIANADFYTKLTVVIYMGVSSASHIQQELLHGLPASTPVAIIQNASLPQQRQVLCTLDSLVTTLQREQLASPSVLVVGDVMQGLLAAQQQDENLRHQGKLA